MAPSKGSEGSGMLRDDVTRIAIDIGGTFTDVVLEHRRQHFSTKVLTTHSAPEEGALAGLSEVVASAGIKPAEIAAVIHATTLATNAIIERRGARTAFVTTDGFRDVLEMRNESRFEQYDVNIQLPRPLVPRSLRIPVSERIDASGRVLRPLSPESVSAAIDTLAAAEVQSVAVGFLHSYVNPRHEQAFADELRRRLPGIPVSLSSQVSPEMREYERFSTTVANAYVRPLMEGYLLRFSQRLRDLGITGPLLLMLSSGGLTTFQTAAKFPIRLVESGPAAGAIFASRLAQENGVPDLVSFDMGGTTAKICMITDATPQTSRVFEVAREYRFVKGSGLPLRIPVIELVEIGAGGGSIAHVDSLRRIAVGPESASSEPGPACYGRGGERPTVTDADLLLGRIDPALFSGGRMQLDAEASRRSLDQYVARPQNLSPEAAAFGVAEMVEENMANAARVHAVENGVHIEPRTLLAFGGAAPMHAARLAEKLDIPQVIVPVGAGVGSAVGLLCAPAAFEVVRSFHQRVSTLDFERVNALLQEMQDEAAAVVEQASFGAPVDQRRSAFMRYVGQGHEVEVPLPSGRFGPDQRVTLLASFEERYRELYGRTIPNLDAEVLSWSVRMSTAPARAAEPIVVQPRHAPERQSTRLMYDYDRDEHVEIPVYSRRSLRPGAEFTGPAIVAEDETTTFVTAAFKVNVDGRGNLVLKNCQGESNRA